MSGRMEIIEGIPFFVPNDVFNPTEKNFYISYNSQSSYYGCDTTAIVRSDGIRPEKFLILNGNHVKELMNIGTYNGCVDYFKKNINKKNKYSENWDEELQFIDGKIYYSKI